RSRAMMPPELTPQQQAEALRLRQALRAAFQQEAEELARHRAAKPTGQLLGATEFEVRDRLHALGAKALEVALAERKKGGTTAPAAPARAAARRPGSSAGRARPS